jgi:hypothetical protein
LGHDKFDVFALETTIINLFIIVVILFRLLVLDCLALTILMYMIMSSMITPGGLCSCKLLRCCCLGL